MNTSTDSNSGSLTGLRVIDLSRVLGGPFCAQMLADHGADVVKIEPPTGDETRTWGPPFRDGLSAYFAGANRNKRCMTLDLARPEGRDVLLRLLQTADVLIENFRVGTLEKWGLGFSEVLAPRFPRLVHCRITGFGETGPLGSHPGYDAAAQAWSGMMSINGDPETGPLRMGLPIVDLAAGMNACIGILAALHEREKSGLGQSVATSLFETGLALLHPHASNWFMSGRVPGLTGSAHTNISPYDLFNTKTTPVFLAIGNNSQFAKLCDRLNVAELAKDARFIDNKDRLRNREELKTLLEKALENEDGKALAEELLPMGVPAGPVLSVAEAFEHPQAKALGAKQMRGSLGHVAPPVRMSRTPASVRSPAETLGYSSESILSDAGFSPEEIDSLLTKKIVRSAE